MIKNPNVLQFKIDRILKIYPDLEPIYIIDIQNYIDEIVNIELAKKLCYSNSIQASIDQFKKNL